ncbi:Protein of unknown function [Gryllus bimaculatus]|nr:Protein of unknown function [Gryllus bimaculatus]
MDYDALLLLKKFSDTISTIVPTDRNALMLRAGLETLEEGINISITETEYFIPEILSSDQFVTKISYADEQSECQGINSEGPEINHNKKIRVEKLKRDSKRKIIQQKKKKFIHEVLERTAIG